MLFNGVNWFFMLLAVFASSLAKLLTERRLLLLGVLTSLPILAGGYVNDPYFLSLVLASSAPPWALTWPVVLKVVFSRGGGGLGREYAMFTLGSGTGFALGATLSGALYALDGGSLVKKLDVRGDATVWSVVVDDALTDLAVYNSSLKLDLILRKEPEARCWATSEGVVCCRNSWCGVVEPGETVVEIEPLNELHGFAVKSDSYIKVHSDLGVQAVKGAVKVVDEKASLLRSKRYALSIEHLLGFTDIVLESPAKPVGVEISRAVINTSPGIHECGGFAHGEVEVKAVEKPSRVQLLIGSTVIEKAGSVETCLSSTDSIPIVAVDPVANDSLKLLELRPETRYIPPPKVGIELKHFENYSEVEIVRDSDAEVVEAKLCCYNMCSDLAKQVEGCKLPAYVAVKVKRSGFIYSYRFDIAIPALVDEAADSVKGSKAKIIRISRGGFVASGVIPEQPAVPPIHDLHVCIAPRGITLEFMSRAIGRGVIVLPNGFVEGFILKHGKNSVELPFTDKLFIALQTNLRWVYGVELKPEQLLLAGKVHAELLAEALEKVLKGLNLLRLVAWIVLLIIAVSIAYALFASRANQMKRIVNYNS